MNTNTETDFHIAELQRRKQSMRTRLKNMTPTEKIRQLEALQARYYELLQIRAANGGRPVPDEWRRWKKAQAKN